MGDVVLCTRNLWDIGLQYGSWGTLVQIEDEPRLLKDKQGNEGRYALGACSGTTEAADPYLRRCWMT